MKAPDLFWLVVLIVSTIGPSVLKALKGRKSSMTDEEWTEQESPDDEPESEYGFEEPSPEAPSPQYYSGVEDMASRPEYFTYESFEENTSKAYEFSAATVAEQVAEPTILPDEADPEAVGMNLMDEPFDLRKALIYQTILENDYIPDMKVK